MRILLVLTSCVGLALFAGAAQQDDQDSNKGKKKGGNAQPQQQQQQVVAPQTGKKFKAGPGGGNVQNFQQPATTHYNATGKHAKNWQGPVTGQTETNVSERTNLNSSKSNKLESFHKGGTEKWKGPSLNAKQGKFQKQHFDLQTNNKQVVINKYKTVNFNQNYKIAGAQNWKGAKY